MAGHNLYMHTKFQDLEVLRKFDQYNSALLNQPYIVYTALLEKTTHYDRIKNGHEPDEIRRNLLKRI